MVASYFGLKSLPETKKNNNFWVKFFFPNLQTNINKTKPAFE